MEHPSASNSFLFQFLPQRNAELERVLRPIATIQDIPAKEIINSPGDFIDGLYYIYSGRTKNYIMNADGIEKVLYTLSEGWLFGEGIGKFSSETTIFSAAVEDTEIWRLSYQQNQQLLREQPEYTQLLLRCVTYKQIYLRYEVENLCFNSCKERLKRAICTEVDQSTLIDSAWYELNHQYSHYELSILISSARVTVSKLLSELCNDNFIGVLNRKIQVNAKQYDEYISNMKIL